MYSQDKYNRLIDQLIKYEDQYYNQDLTEISDAEFDSLYFEAKTIENLHKEWIREDSPIKRIMGKATKGLKEVKHKVPLLSLSKAMDFEELKQWLISLQANGINQFYVECKHDGLACALHYTKGKFVQAVTRGNGLIGNDVTAVCWQIPSIPKEISYKENLEVRGEIFLTKSGLANINEYIKKYQPKESEKKNVRNTASGLLRDENPNLAKSQYLKFSAYMSLDTLHDTHGDSMKWLQTLGFLTTDTFVSNFTFTVTNSNTIFTKIQKKLEQIYKDREKFDFDIDGMVFKVNSYQQQQQLGNKRNVPNWAIAYKFPQEEKVSILRDVKWELGAKGTFTPVAIIDPVNILGAMVESPTLHNMDEIKRLDIKIGDHVVVTRRGDVIPKIIKVITELRDGTEKAIIPPEICPVCGNKITIHDAYLKCDNDNCLGRITGKIIDFVKKLEIKDFGEKLITALVKRKSLTKVTDIYRLKASDISILDKQGAVSAAKVIQRINDSKQAPLSKIIAGLGINNVGEVTGKDLAEYYSTLERFKNANINELMAMNNIGEVVAVNIIKWINNNQDLIDDLISLGLGANKKTTIINNTLSNKTFAFTGTLSIPRKKFQEKVEQNGGTISSIKQGLDFLIIGEGAKQPKIIKAQKYGAKVLTENDFEQLIK